MKRILSTIVASLVALAFAGFAFAAEPATPVEPASPDSYQTVKPDEAKKPVTKKHPKKHHKKHHKHNKSCKHAKPAPVKTEVPSPDQTAPAAK